MGLVIPAALLACAINAALATNVHPSTVEAVVGVEGGGNPIALNVNRLQGPQPRPASVADAVRIAEGYIARGFSIDLGSDAGEQPEPAGTRLHGRAGA